MLNFNHEITQVKRRNQDLKKNIKSDLGLAMKQLDEKKKEQKRKEFEIDQLHLVGPPMMQEIESNQRRLEAKTK